MGLLDRPKKPLNVLTLDGGGLQATATLLILDELLNTIQQQNNAPRKPRPCDVFDVIGGIGAGGWLALFLGRFQMDIPSCLTEWYSLLRCITPKSRGQTFRRRVFQHSYFDTPSLIRRIDNLADLYGISDTLIEPNPRDARCKYTFVAARRDGSHDEYSLFRTYEVPDNKELKPGADNPAHYRLSNAFAITGAAKYFSPSRKEIVPGNGKVRFLDSIFPEPHNVTMLALQEIWALFGHDVPLSAIVNIGPGMPNQIDMKLISRFSWGLPTPVHTPCSSPPSLDSSRSSETPKAEQESIKPLQKSHRRYTNSPRDKQLANKEEQIVKDIHHALRKRYPGVADLYFKLAPEQAPSGTAQNDALVPDVAIDATDKYLCRPAVRVSIDRAGERLSVL